MGSSRRFLASAVGATAFFLALGSARAASTEVGPGDDVESAMNALQPGDELVLRGGDYTLTDAWHITMKGTAQAPIVVRAKDGEHPHLDRPAIDQNIIDFDDVEYAEVRGIEFSGGSAGLRMISANFFTIQDCSVHDTDDAAITANSGSEYTNLSVIHNEIYNTGATGEGMYIGCNNNGCRVHDSLFERNYIHDTNGPSVTQGDGIEIKEGSYANIVRDNVIHDTGYPCIITYSTVGNGGPNLIERNLLWNCGDHGIQSAADVIIRNNIILGSAADGIANQPHQDGTPSNIQILNNTILHPQNDAIASTGITGSVLIANNAVYSQQANAIRVGGDLSQVVLAGNVGEGALSGLSSGLAPGNMANDFVAASYSGTLPNDVYPKAGGALIAAGDTQYVVNDDFNGTLRNGVADVGAYAFDANGNPGWTLAAGFKDETPVTTGGTGGSSATGGSGGAAQGGSSTGGSGATSSGGNGGNAGSGANAAKPGAEDSSGCGCRTAGGSRGSGAPGVIALLALAFSARRHRGRSRRLAVAACRRSPS
jgi:hypothetical protein